MVVRLTDRAFDPAAELRIFSSESGEGLAGQAGGLASFVGFMRASGGGDGLSPLAAMEIEHWPGATEATIGEMGGLIAARFELLGWRVVHRYGLIEPGQAIVLCAVKAGGRRAALAGCSCLMDFLKSRAPFWKEEVGVSGERHWVPGRADDEAAWLAWGLGA